MITKPDCPRHVGGNYAQSKNTPITRHRRRWRQANLYEFETNLIYTVCSRISKTKKKIIGKNKLNERSSQRRAKNL